MKAPTDKKPRDPHGLIVEQPGKLILDPGLNRNRVVLIGLLAMVVMGGLAFAFVHFNRRGVDAGLVGVAVAMGIAVISSLVLALKRAKVVFDLEARHLRRGRDEVPFEDIVAVVLSPVGTKPRKAKGQSPQPFAIGLVVRSKESDLAERVSRLSRGMLGGSDTGQQLASLADRLRSEPETLAKTVSPVAAFLAADRLAGALQALLVDLRAEAEAWTHKDLAKSLRKRLLASDQPPADPGSPPDQVSEESGPTGPALLFRRPKRQPLVAISVNLGMLLILLAIFFLVPSRDSERDFQWGQFWPLVLAIVMVIPALLKSLFSDNRLELGAERLRYVTRFLGEKSREVEVAKLRFLFVDQTGSPTLALVADGPPLRLAMSLEAAKWVKTRIEVFLVSGN